MHQHTQYLTDTDRAIAVGCCAQLTKADIPWLSVMVIQAECAPNSWILLICLPERTDDEIHSNLKSLCKSFGWHHSVETEEVGIETVDAVGGIMAVRIDNQDRRDSNGKR